MSGATGAPKNENWLTADAFAAAVGISERAGRKALARAFEGLPWRGKALVVRKLASRGGAGG